MSLCETLRVKPGIPVNLSQWDPDDCGKLDKKSVGEEMEKNLRRLGELQYLLYAENKRSVLIVLQAMDAGGKDGTITHVMGPLNSQSCKVTSFKAPTAEELAHDFFWRIHKAVPRHGEIMIFNRSHYEDVLIVRVHGLVEKKVWKKRYGLIRDFEKQLTQGGTHIFKFFLHISKEEQLTRFQERLHDPSKQWKINPHDFMERKYWDDYMAAFEDALTECSTESAPWFIIPANKKWFRNYAIAKILVEELEKLGMRFPKPDFDFSSIKLE